MGSYDIITVGGATEDIFFNVDDYVMVESFSGKSREDYLAFEYGGKVGVTDTETCFGGGAANAAVALSRLGFRTALMSAIGKDERGERIMRNLKRNGVATRYIDTQKNRQSGVSFVLVSPSREHIVFTYRGANDSLDIDKKEAKKLVQATWVYVTSLSTSWKSTLSNVFANAEQVAWNPGREQLAAGAKVLSVYLKKTDVLICNRHEASELAASAGSIQSLLKALYGLGPRIVVVTDGEKGAFAYDGRKTYSQKAIKVKKPLNTTGVGDAFGSSLIGGLELYKGDISKAMALGARNAASVVRHHGAQAGLIKL